MVILTKIQINNCETIYFHLKYLLALYSQLVLIANQQILRVKLVLLLRIHQPGSARRTSRHGSRRCVWRLPLLLTSPPCQPVPYISGAALSAASLPSEPRSVAISSAMLCYQSVSVLLLAAAAAPAPAPAPDGGSYGAPPPVAGGAAAGFGVAGAASGPLGGFASSGFGGGAAGRPAAPFGGRLGGAASGRRGALREPVGPGLRPDGLPTGPGMPYSFSWAVDEPEYGNQYGHQEESDGVVTQGEYRVLLPDGRTQIVTYSVQGDSGFQAQVTYEGEAQFPPAGRPALPGAPAAGGVPGVPGVPGLPGAPGAGRGVSGVLGSASGLGRPSTSYGL